jgi:hypothetical protein
MNMQDEMPLLPNKLPFPLKLPLPMIMKSYRQRQLLLLSIMRIACERKLHNKLLSVMHSSDVMKHSMQHWMINKHVLRARTQFFLFIASKIRHAPHLSHWLWF